MIKAEVIFDGEVMIINDCEIKRVWDSGEYLAEKDRQNFDFFHKIEDAVAYCLEDCE